MKPKHYLIKVLISGLICCFLFVSLVSFQMGSPTESSRWIYEINTIKLRIAKSTASPKLIIVSGSSGLFGISCQMIQQETNFPCVNGANHLGLDIDYILDFSRNLASEGDIILMPLEYGVYQYDGKLSDVLIDYVFARDPGYITSRNLITQLHLFGGISFIRISRGIIGKFRPPTQRTFGYQSTTINEYGDETNNREADITPSQVRRVASENPISGLVEGGSVNSTTGMKLISEFVTWCHNNNIQVLATWPSTIYFEEYNQSGAEIYLQSIKDFYQSIKVPVLGNPRNFMYDHSWFYDTRYHLHDRGTRQNTKKIIDLLQPYL